MSHPSTSPQLSLQWCRSGTLQLNPVRRYATAPRFHPPLSTPTPRGFLQDDRDSAKRFRHSASGSSFGLCCFPDSLALMMASDLPMTVAICCSAYEQSFLRRHVGLGACGHPCQEDARKDDGQLSHSTAPWLPGPVAQPCIQVYGVERNTVLSSGSRKDEHAVVHAAHPASPGRSTGRRAPLPRD